jgi:hypothetical protein
MFWEKISTLWNESECEPETLILPELHPYEFLSSEKLTFDKVERLSPATPSKVKEKLALMIVALRRCIEKWERSGQGEGGVDPYDDDDDIRPRFGTTRPPEPDSVRHEHERCTGRKAIHQRSIGSLLQVERWWRCGHWGRVVHLYARNTHLIVYDDLQPHSLFHFQAWSGALKTNHKTFGTLYENRYRLGNDIPPAQIVYVASVLEADRLSGSFVPPLE